MIIENIDMMSIVEQKLNWLKNYLEESENFQKQSLNDWTFNLPICCVSMC